MPNLVKSWGFTYNPLFQVLCTISHLLQNGSTFSFLFNTYVHTYINTYIHTHINIFFNLKFTQC